MRFSVEVVLGQGGVDAFGTHYETGIRRLRYELELALTSASNGGPRGILVRREYCRSIARKDERATYLRDLNLNRSRRVSPFIDLDPKRTAIQVHMDGPQKHGHPRRLSLQEASRTALSTVTTAEFPHLYSLRETMANIRFLEINPRAARRASDRFEDRLLRPDASNLAAVLAYLKAKTSDELRPDGVLSDIATDLSALVPSVRRLKIRDDANEREYAFSLEFANNQVFSSRVISDGTLRLLALLAVLDDPDRRGTLCFEEPENGVHEGRVPMLVDFLRNAATVSTDPSFQVLLATHSPKVMSSLHDDEIVAADSVTTIDPDSKIRSTRTRMRTGVSPTEVLLDPEKHLTRSELERLLHSLTDAA